ncbi:hypothetical protein [Lacrimispora amygdalina]
MTAADCRGGIKNSSISLNTRVAPGTKTCYDSMWRTGRTREELYGIR